MQKMIRVNTTNGCIAWINLDNIITITQSIVVIRLYGKHMII